jgi:hypothetical protein
MAKKTLKSYIAYSKGISEIWSYNVYVNIGHVTGLLFPKRNREFFWMYLGFLDYI